MDASYRISLQVSHPCADPQSIITEIGLQPTRFWAAGDQRATPTGKLLEGRRRESYCLFDLADQEDGTIADCLRHALVDLEKCAEFIQRMRATDGQVSFFVSWSPNGGAGETFDVPLMAEMARLGIDLGIQPLT